MPKITPSEYTCTLSESRLKQAKEELNEDPETRLQKCQEVLDLISESNPEIHVNPDPKFLIRFLRARKFNVKRAADNVIAHYTKKYEDPEIFENLLPSVVSPFFEHMPIGYLPKCDEKGRRVIFQNGGSIDFSNLPIEQGFRIHTMILEMLLLDEDIQVGGLIEINNMRGFSLNHFNTIRPHLQRVSNLLDKTIPMRFKGSIVINPPGLIGELVKLVKLVLSKKLQERINIYSGTSVDSELQRIFGKECLPEAFGGDEKSDFMNDWKQRLLDCEEYFKEQQKFGISKSGTYTLVNNM